AQHVAMVNRLAQTRQPAIVITGNGMCSAGRVVNYLKAMLNDPRHNVIFTGFQARGTPGRAIQEYGPQGGYVALEGERFGVRAGASSPGGHSAPGEEAGRRKSVAGLRHWPERVRLVHGEHGSKQALAAALLAKARRSGKKLDVLIP